MVFFSAWHGRKKTARATPAFPAIVPCMRLAADCVGAVYSDLSTFTH